MTNVWKLGRGETRSVRLDPRVAITSLPYWPKDADWDAHYIARVARNLRERAERKEETCAFLRPQAGPL